MRSVPIWVKERVEAIMRDPVCGRCIEWLESLPDDTELIQERDRSWGLGNSPSVLQKDLEAIRATISSLRMQQARPLPSAGPSAGLEEKVRQWVASRAAVPRVNTGAGRVEIDFDKENALALLCWLIPDAIAKALLKTRPADTPPQLAEYHANMREAAKLATDVHEYELLEEAIIRRLAEAGAAVLRRADVRPSIILGVVVDPKSALGRTTAD